MKKCKNFTINELLRSETATKYGIKNIPNDEQLNNLYILMEQLQKIRDKYGAPIYITSGFRCEKLNQMVGGSKTSHHKRGMAADLDVGDNVELFELIKREFKFTQLIAEKPKFDKNKKLKSMAWIHFSYDLNNLKNQVIC